MVYRRCIWKNPGTLHAHVVNSNNAIHSLPTVKVLLGIVAIFEKIYDVEPILIVFFVIGEDVCTICFRSVCCEKCVAARYYAAVWKQLLISNDRNRVRWIVVGLCTGLKISAWMLPQSTHLFSPWSIHLIWNETTRKDYKYFFYQCPHPPVSWWASPPSSSASPSSCRSSSSPAF